MSEFILITCRNASFIFYLHIMIMDIDFSWDQIVKNYIQTEELFELIVICCLIVISFNYLFDNFNVLQFTDLNFSSLRF